MRLYNKVVFDDTASQSGEVFTAPMYNSLLGAAEKLLVQVRAGQTRGTAPVSLAVKVYDSCDGIDWIQRGSTTSTTLTGNAADTVFVQVTGGPKGGLVRLGFTVTPSAGNGSAKIKAIACGRGESLR